MQNPGPLSDTIGAVVVLLAIILYGYLGSQKTRIPVVLVVVFSIAGAYFTGLGARFLAHWMLGY